MLEPGLREALASLAELQQLLQQEYAALRIKGPYSLLHPAYRSLFGRWFPQSGREPDNDPGFEIYWNSPQTTAETDLLTEICIPLK